MIRASTRRTALLAWASLVLLACPGAAQSVPPRSETLEVITRNGTLTFTVELALTPDEQARGLMFRTELPQRHGMLFDFGAESPLSFWMRNTLIPLDMLFIGGDGVIRRIHANATPLSETPIPSGGPARAVLEIAGGSAARLGIAVGDRVRHRLLTGG